nr:type II toxin-antitoxin system VapC family toxin [uncultured Rhodopila sp.]
MDLLLDTHAFLWWVTGDAALSAAARNAIGDTRNRIFVSAASAWEIATKVRIGKLPGAAAAVVDLAAVLADQGFGGLPVSFAHGQAAGALPGPHKDPFDRMLIAQAMLDGMVLVSNERQFDLYGVRRLW